MVTCVGSGGEHHRQVELHGSRTVGRAALRIVSDGGDGEGGAVVVGVEHRVAHQSDGDIVACAHRHVVAVGPVHELVAVVRGAGGEGHRGMLIDVGERGERRARHLGGGSGTHGHVLDGLSYIDSDVVLLALHNRHIVDGGGRIVGNAVI